MDAFRYDLEMKDNLTSYIYLALDISKCRLTLYPNGLHRLVQWIDYIRTGPPISRRHS